MKKVFEIVTAGKRVSLWEDALKTETPQIRTQFSIRHMSDAVVLYFGTHFLLMEPENEFVAIGDEPKMDEVSPLKGGGFGVVDDSTRETDQDVPAVSEDN